MGLGSKKEGRGVGDKLFVSYGPSRLDITNLDITVEVGSREIMIHGGPSVPINIVGALLQY